MTQIEIDRWNAIADDIENRDRVDGGLREIANQGLRIGNNLAIFEIGRLETHPVNNKIEKVSKKIS